jgi:crotonobetainyl-CoA:carnitine CoA-transferase CaiB-like acyl-CoA transferase
VALLDLIAGLECAVGALAALVGRGRTRRVQVNLVEAGVTSLINVLGNFLASGQEPSRHGNAHPNIAPYESFEARDGHLVIAVGNDAQFGRLLRVLDLDDSDGRYVTNAMRLGRQSELSAWIGSAVSRRGRDELVAALAEADVPAGPVNSVSEALAAMGEGWTSTLDGITLPASPIHVDGGAPPVRRPPPRLAEHQDAVLAETAADQAGT